MLSSSTRKLKIQALDGFPLGATLYEPWAPNAESRLVVINSAMDVKQADYRDFARYLVSEGFHVLTWDYRGMGESASVPLRQMRSSILDWGTRDFAGVLDWAYREFPRFKYTVVGHGIGGQLVGLTESSRMLDSFVAVAAQGGYWKLFRGMHRYFFVAMRFGLIPLGSKLVGYLPSKPSSPGESPPKNSKGFSLRWAPWARGSRFVSRKGGDSIREAFGRLKLPVLWFSITDDPYAPEAATLALSRWYSGCRIEHHRIGPEADLPQGRKLGHFGFFRPRRGLGYWRQIAEWVRDPGHAAQEGVAPALLARE